jgi:hypothetical protein
MQDPEFQRLQTLRFNRTNTFFQRNLNETNYFQQTHDKALTKPTILNKKNNKTLTKQTILIKKNK